MATRSYIGMYQPDGTIKAIYCHYDGYTSGVGRVLQKYWRDETRVEELLDLGDISSVNGPDIVHNVLSYQRDFFEQNDNSAKIFTKTQWQNLLFDGVNYLYAFDPQTNQWTQFWGGNVGKLTYNQNLELALIDCLGPEWETLKEGDF